MNDVAFVNDNAPGRGLDVAMPRTVLVIVEEATVRELIADNMRYAGLSPVLAATVSEGERFVGQVMPDVMVFDLACGETDGLMLAAKVRDLNPNPALRIIALGDAPSGDTTADASSLIDEWVSKPFAPIDLVARLAYLLTPTFAKQAPGLITIGSLAMNVVERTVEIHTFRGVQALDLPAAEFRLLHYLLVSPDKAQSRQHLLAKAWRNRPGMDLRTVDQNIKRLRMHLAEAGLPELIETVHGIGYRLAARKAIATNS